MIQVEKLKFVTVTPPGARVNNASLTTNVIDTLGFTRLTLLVILGATDIAMTSLKVQESDVITDATTLNGGTDITNTVYGTANNSGGTASTFPAAGDSNKTFAIVVDLLGPRKRYLKPIATMGNGASGTFATILAILSGGQTTPSTIAARGYAQLING